MKTERKVRRFFADHDMIIHKLRRRKHWVVCASRPAGTPTYFCIPVSASDWRSMLNLVADLKRAA